MRRPSSRSLTGFRSVGRTLKRFRELFERGNGSADPKELVRELKAVGSDLERSGAPSPAAITARRRLRPPTAPGRDRGR